MSDQFQRIVSLPQPEAHEAIETHQVTRAFYEEIHYREEFERYCQWYSVTAKRHQQELEQMRGELNIFSWLFRNPFKSKKC